MVAPREQQTLAGAGRLWKGERDKAEWLYELGGSRGGGSAHAPLPTENQQKQTTALFLFSPISDPLFPTDAPGT